MPGMISLLCVFCEKTAGDHTNAWRLHDEMRFAPTSIIGIHTSFQFLSAQNAVRFGDVAFAMHPLGLNGVEPGTFGGQQTGQDAHALPSLLHLLIVAADPGANELALM